jgi:integration host factor subunit beta
MQRAVAEQEPALTRAQLVVDLAASNPHLRVADVEFIVGAIFDHIIATLARGGRVQMRGFGTFTVKRRNACMGRNPRSSEEVPMHQKTVPFFKAGKKLRGRLNRRGTKHRS